MESIVALDLARHAGRRESFPTNPGSLDRSMPLPYRVGVDPAFVAALVAPLRVAALLLEDLELLAGLEARACLSTPHRRRRRGARLRVFLQLRVAPCLVRVEPVDTGRICLLRRRDVRRERREALSRGRDARRPFLA